MSSQLVMEKLTPFVSAYSVLAVALAAGMFAIEAAVSHPDSL